MVLLRLTEWRKLKLDGQMDLEKKLEQGKVKKKKIQTISKEIIQTISKEMHKNLRKSSDKHLYFWIFHER